MPELVRPTIKTHKDKVTVTHGDVETFTTDRTTFQAGIEVHTRLRGQLGEFARQLTENATYRGKLNPVRIPIELAYSAIALGQYLSCAEDEQPRGEPTITFSLEGDVIVTRTKKEVIKEDPQHRVRSALTTLGISLPMPHSNTIFHELHAAKDADANFYPERVSNELMVAAVGFLGYVDLANTLRRSTPTVSPVYRTGKR